MTKDELLESAKWDRHMADVKEAAAAGKTVQHNDGTPAEPNWNERDSYLLYWNDPPEKYRIAPDPVLRTKRAEELPHDEGEMSCQYVHYATVQNLLAIRDHLREMDARLEKVEGRQ